MKELLEKKINEVKARIKAIDEEADKQKTVHKAELKGLNAMLRLYQDYEYLFVEKK